MKLLIAALTTFVASYSFACEVGEGELDHHLFNARIENEINSFMPQALGMSEVTEKDFEALTEKVEEFYRPVFKEQGFSFKVERFWNSHDDNAFAGFRPEAKEKYVVVHGGYARKRHMTDDAFLSVICHEVGHHLGGFPKKALTPWASVEGQADYFSTLKCMKSLLRNDPANKKFGTILSFSLPKEVRKKCLAQYPKTDDFFVCLRSAQAAQDYGKVLVDIGYRGMNMNVGLTSPATDIRKVTSWDHSHPQCRLDTKFQGALCNEDSSLSDKDELLGTCNSKTGHSLGIRPPCWFVAAP